MDARAKAERDNDRAARGERIASYREAGMTWPAIAEQEGCSRDEVRICAEAYRLIAVTPWEQQRRYRR